MNKYSTILIIIVSIFIIGAQKSPLIPTKEFKTQEKWVDSVYTNMTQKERFAQLLTIPVYSNKGLADDNRVKLQIMKQKVGAVLFMGGNPTHQVELTNQFQKISKVPLLVAMDAERDFGKLLDSAHTNPYNLLLGAVEDDKLIEQMGKRIGAHSKRLGVHVVFASVPVVQTENNLATIGNRSYGEDIAQVAKKITAFTRGIQSTGTIAGVKYFPSVSNSTLTIEGELPELTLSVEQLDSIQFVPYLVLYKLNIFKCQT